MSELGKSFVSVVDCQHSQELSLWLISVFQRKTRQSTLVFRFFILLLLIFYSPFGNLDFKIFVQPVETSLAAPRLHVIDASSGQRVCAINPINGNAPAGTVTAHSVCEWDHPSRLGSRSRRFLVTGHADGCLQVWDLVTAVENLNREESFGHDRTSPKRHIKKTSIDASVGVS